jgi:hypothetical protein
MAGQSAGKSTGSVMSEISSICERGGVSAEETSAIGGAGRRGSDGYGSSSMAPKHRIDEEFMAKSGGNASTGQTGPDSGFGKTF